MLKLKIITSILIISITVFSQNDSTVKDSTINNIKLRTSIGLINNQIQLTGGRSKASIMMVVLSNLQEIRNAYNKRLRDKPGLKGAITVKFAINELGKVVYCNVLESSVKDVILEINLSEEIMKWTFNDISNMGKSGDITEVVYPFVFDPNDNVEKSTPITNNPKKSTPGTNIASLVFILSLIALSSLIIYFSAK